MSGSFIRERIRENERRAQTMTSGDFAVDFMARLDVAERRDEESMTRKQTTAAEVMDAMTLDATLDDDAVASAGVPAATMLGQQQIVMPTVDQIKRVAELFWKSPAKARSQFHDSSLAVDGSFVVPVEAELDEPTFCKMIALVQRPEYGFKRGHSAAQRDGWHAAFRNMDSDNAGTLSKGKVKRFLERRRRAFMETLKQKELQEMREAEGGTALADELQSRVDFHLKQQRARDAACAALDDVLAAGPTFGSLFPLTMALAPPLFACERATLWLARYEDDLPPPLPPAGDESFISRDGGSFVSRDGGSFTSAAGSSSFTSKVDLASFKGGGFDSGSSLIQGSPEAVRAGAMMAGGGIPDPDAPKDRGKRILFTRFGEKNLDGESWDLDGEQNANASADGAPGVAEPLMENSVDERASVVDARQRSNLRQSNVSLDSSASGEGSESVDAPKEVTLPINRYSIAGAAAAMREPQIVNNAYADSRFDTSFDEKTGFVTRNILVIPMFATAEEKYSDDKPLCVGVIQLINKLPKEAVPPSEFGLRDVQAGMGFMTKLVEAINLALPKEAQRARDAVDKEVRRRKKKEERRRAKEERAELAQSMKQKAAEKGRSQSPTRRNVLAQAQALSQSPEFQQKKLRRRRRRSHERDD